MAEQHIKQVRVVFDADGNASFAEVVYVNDDIEKYHVVFEPHASLVTSKATELACHIAGARDRADQAKEAERLANEEAARAAEAASAAAREQAEIRAREEAADNDRKEAERQAAHAAQSEADKLAAAKAE